MARAINRLSAAFVKTVSKPGLHADGQGLYLSTTNGGKRWLFVFRWDGRRREMGLGPATAVSLARARELAAEARARVAEGINPIEARNAERLAQSEQEPVPTFGAFADSYIGSVEEGWRNEKHRQQWRNTLKQHARKLQALPVDQVATQHVLEVLQPIWLSIPETASRVRGRIEKVLNAAKARGFRSHDSINPAQWAGHLEMLLPKRQRLTRGHHAAMPYADISDLWAQLTCRPAVAARALQFLILTAARSGEVLGAKWGEIDGDTWNIPAGRMKAGMPHTVTLTPAAMTVLDSLGERDPSKHVFPGQKGGGMSNMAMEMLMRRLGLGHFTVHGFRSSFKDWALNETQFPDEISEEALAHVVGSKVRRAYRRGQALERRRALMEAWATHVTGGAVELAAAA